MDSLALGCTCRLRYIGGPGGAPRKIKPQMAVKWPNIGHLWVHIRIYGYKLPLKHVGTTYKCPRISRGDSRGLSPRNSHWLPPIYLSLPTTANCIWRWLIYVDSCARPPRQGINNTVSAHIKKNNIAI